jgi:hypothetical protein
MSTKTMYYICKLEGSCPRTWEYDTKAMNNETTEIAFFSLAGAEAPLVARCLGRQKQGFCITLFGNPRFLAVAGVSG